MSNLSGHENSYARQEQVGEIDFACMKEFGATWRMAGHFGVREFVSYATHAPERLHASIVD